MVSCPCLNYLSRSEDTKQDDRNGDLRDTFGMNSDKEFEDAIGDDETVGSRDSLVLISTSGGFKNETGKYGSSGKTGESWWLNKSVDIVAEGIGVDPHPPIILENYHSLDDFFDENPINTQFSQDWSRKSVEITFPSTKLRPASKIPNSQKKTRSTLGSRKPTILSDWGDVYEGLDSLHFSTRGSILVFQPGISSTFSDPVTARESRLPIIPSEPKKITLQSGEVMGMYLSKKGYMFQILSLNSSLDEVVELFLIPETGATLPLSFNENNMNRPKIMSKNRMQMTIEQNLGPDFDAKTKGLMFCSGVVNSRICYKMAMCDLSTIENLFSMFRREDNFTKE